MNCLFFSESIFTTTCCCCCVGCSPVAVRIFIKDANNDDVMTIKLTGNVTKFPLDTAQLQTPSGKTFALVAWWVETSAGRHGNLLFGSGSRNSAEKVTKTKMNLTNFSLTYSYKRKFGSRGRLVTPSRPLMLAIEWPRSPRNERWPDRFSFIFLGKLMRSH